MNEDFLDKLEAVLAQDPRFHKDAYLFIFDALEYTVKKLGKAELATAAERHISGRDLLMGISEYGLDQFGPLTLAVFTHWGLKQTRDFGQIVFNLVEAGLMSKTDRDNIEDFVEVYSFEEEFNWQRRRADIKRLAT
jgi:uncharacterized repeat protein (TIGR04138 family)